MEKAPDESTAIDHESQLIDAAEREADALLEAGACPKPPPDAVPGFEIMEEIGRGGMGVVYKALQVSTKRVVALKIMLSGWFASRSARNRFQREVELTARFQHPGIVRVLESGFTSTGQQYYAMDYVDAVHSDHWISASQPDVRTTLGLFVTICEAVEHAHEHGVVHRDLKPANVLVDDEGKPHILDFGLSKATDQGNVEDAFSVAVSMPGQVVGTLRYLSPEQAAGTPDEVDARTDVYALGVMLYGALTGSAPIDTVGSPSDVMQRIREDPPAPPSSLSDRVDGELGTIILRALEKEKRRRYQTVAEFGEDIGRYLRAEPILARPPSSFYILRKKLVKQRVRFAAAALAVILALGGIWGGTWWRNRSLEQQRQRELASARVTLLGIQCRLEEGLARTEHLLAEAQPLMRQYPDMPEARLVYVQVQHRLAQDGDDKSIAGRAIDALRDGIGRHRFPWVYRALLLEIYDSLGNPRAGQLRREGEQEIPDTAEAWYIRSFATLDAHKALDYAQQAVERDHRHRLAWERSAFLCLQTGNVDGALSTAKVLIELGCDPVYCARFQGRVLMKYKRYEEAVERYTQAIDLEPTWLHHRYRALAYLCVEEYDKAIADYTKAAELHGADEMWERFHRATPLWITGRTDEAEEDYREFREWRGLPTFADARLSLILYEQDRQEEANRILTAVRSTVQDRWLGEVLACLACEITPEILVAAAESEDPPNRKHLCKAYYYAAEAGLLTERMNDAREWFRKCVGMDMALDPASAYLDPMSEYHLARWRLRQLSPVPTEDIAPQPEQSTPAGP